MTHSIKSRGWIWIMKKWLCIPWLVALVVTHRRRQWAEGWGRSLHQTLGRVGFHLLWALVHSCFKGPDCRGQLRKQYRNYVRDCYETSGNRVGSGTHDGVHSLEKNVKREAEVDRKWAQDCQREASVLSPPRPDICFYISLHNTET